jgi:hypothetical protein
LDKKLIEFSAWLARAGVLTLEAVSGPGAVQTTVCAVPLSTTTATGSSDGDTRE